MTDHNKRTDDEILEAYKKAGIIPEDEVTTQEEEEKPVPAKVEPVIPPKPAEDEEDEEAEKPVVVEPTSTTPPVAPDPAIKSQDDSQTPNETKPRPVKFIPLQQYQAEKAENKKKEEELNTRIAELQAITDGVKPSSDEEYEKELDAFMERTGFSLEDAQRIMPPKKTTAPDPKILDELNSIKAERDTLATEKAQRTEAEHFNKEFSAAETTLADMYPNLTDEKKAEIKTKLDELSHSEQWHKYDLDYVILKNRAALDTVVGTAAPAPRGKTAEAGRAGKNTPGAKQISAADFAGKTDFSELASLDDATRQRVVMEMDPKTYGAFSSYVAQANNAELTVQRNGKTVVLK